MNRAASRSIPPSTQTTRYEIRAAFQSSWLRVSAPTISPVATVRSPIAFVGKTESWSCRWTGIGRTRYVSITPSWMCRASPCTRPRKSTNRPCASIRVAAISSTSWLAQPPIPANRVSSTVANTITDTCQIAPIAIISRNSERYSSCARKLRRVMRHTIRRDFSDVLSLSVVFGPYVLFGLSVMLSLPARSRAGRPGATAAG